MVIIQSIASSSMCSVGMSPRQFVSHFILHTPPLDFHAWATSQLSVTARARCTREIEALTFGYRTLYLFEPFFFPHAGTLVIIDSIAYYADYYDYRYFYSRVMEESPLASKRANARTKDGLQTISFSFLIGCFPRWLKYQG